MKFSTGTVNKFTRMSNLKPRVYVNNLNLFYNLSQVSRYESDNRYTCDEVFFKIKTTGIVIDVVRALIKSAYPFFLLLKLGYYISVKLSNWIIKFSGQRNFYTNDGAVELSNHSCV